MYRVYSKNDKLCSVILKVVVNPKKVILREKKGLQLI